jgi:hypothetical protein
MVEPPDVFLVSFPSPGEGLEWSSLSGEREERREEYRQVEEKGRSKFSTLPTAHRSYL